MMKLKVNPGVCGLQCILTAETNDDDEVTITAETSCQAVKKMIDALEQPIEAMDVCFCKPGTGPVYEAAVNLLHASCPMPSAVLKCIEAEAGLALTRGVEFEFDKNQSCG